MALPLAGTAKPYIQIDRNIIDLLTDEKKYFIDYHYGISIKQS